MYKAVDLEKDENVAVKVVRKYELKPQQVGIILVAHCYYADTCHTHSLLLASKCSQRNPNHAHSQAPVHCTIQKFYRDQRGR